MVNYRGGSFSTRVRSVLERSSVGQLAGEAQRTVGNTGAVPREPAHLRPSSSSAALLFQAKLMS